MKYYDELMKRLQENPVHGITRSIQYGRILGYCSAMREAEKISLEEYFYLIDAAGLAFRAARSEP